MPSVLSAMVTPVINAAAEYDVGVYMQAMIPSSDVQVTSSDVQVTSSDVRVTYV